jgi:hypothetical protein
MALESGTYINSLNASNPASTDGLGQADDHLRLIKSTLLATLPNVAGAVTADHTELSTLDGYTGTTADLNILSGAAAAGVTATEFQYLDGVTSGIQAQIDAITSSGSTVNDGTVTIQAGTLLSTGGSFTTNQASASTITINHDTVSRSNTTTSAAPAAGNTFTAIDQVTSDSYGHITGVRTKTVTMPASASGGISLTDLSVGAEGTASGNGSLSYNSSTGVFTYSPPTAAGLGALTAHPSISAASSSNNSGSTFIQDITLDSNGHVTAIATGTSSASTTLGAVGTYAWLGRPTNNTITAGSSYSGSDLRYAGSVSESNFSDNTAMDINGASPSGTWRAMGEADITQYRRPATLFLRIS